MAFSGCGIAILPCLSYWFGTSLERRYMARQHIIRVDLICVVFLGGCIGTALRYACSVIPDCGAFHIGTFAANMAACFVYAALSAWLGGTRRIVGRAKEYVNRGCGMGMCGGLSTMSTLALEEFTMLHDAKPWIVRRIVARPSSWAVCWHTLARMSGCGLPVLSITMVIAMPWARRRTDE